MEVMLLCFKHLDYFLIIFLPRGFRKTAAFDNTFSLFSICFHLLSSSVIVAPVQVGVVWFCSLSIYPQCISNWQRHVQRFSRVTVVALSCKPAAEMRSSFRGLINSVPSNFTPTRFYISFSFSDLKTGFRQIITLFTAPFWSHKRLCQNFPFNSILLSRSSMCNIFILRSTFSVPAGYYLNPTGSTMSKCLRSEWRKLFWC